MRRRLLSALRTTWVSFGVALMVLALLEGVAELPDSMRKRAVDPHRLVIDAAYRSDPTKGPKWVTEYFREFEESLQAEWRPYVYWRRKPYRGTYINIDKAGFRRTWNGTPAPSLGQLKIFMLGGSTMWGEGASDEFTIPSLVSKKLANRVATGVWVTNFGESGYVSTQEFVALMLELQRGNVPDLVVFYDGVNDTSSAFYSGVAGIPLNESHREREFNLRHHLNWREGFVERLTLYDLGRRAVQLFGGRRGRRFPGEDVSRTEVRANAVVDVYLHNVDMVNTLARRYGFQAVFLWQPTLLTEKHLSEQKRQVYERSLARVIRSAPLFREVYKVLGARLKAAGVHNVYDLSGVFDVDDGSPFYDPFHLTEAGNETVAEAVAQILQNTARAAKK